MPSGGGGGQILTLPLSIANGGTGQTTAAAALAALGGVSSPVGIASGGTGQITAAAALAALGGVSSPVPIASGGTGQTTAAAALTALGGALNGNHALKVGSHAGNYTTTATSFTAIDDTNLKATLTVPVGCVAWAIFIGTSVNSAGANTRVGIAIDGTVPVQILQGGAGGIVVNGPFAVQAVLVGDGSSHTFSPQWWNDSGHTATMINIADPSIGDVPSLVVMVIGAA